MDTLEVVKELLEAAMSAPSAGNEQPWQFIVVDDRVEGFAGCSICRRASRPWRWFLWDTQTRSLPPRPGTRKRGYTTVIRRILMKKSLGAKTIVYPTPVFVVGTYDKAGKPNVMTAAWAGICCSSPPCVAVSLRKATYTYGNIMERKAFTVSIPSEDYVRVADYFGMASGKETDKFSASGLTPVKGELVDAPYVKEFPLVLECTLLRYVEIGLHTQFIGEILDVKADESVLEEDGLPDIKKVRPILFSPEGRNYHAVGRYLGKAFSIGKDV